ncbi:MAG: rod shape-determining protein MreD [Bacteroidales bacterium]
MNRDIVINIARYLLLSLVQVLLLDQVNLWSQYSPQLYILFILLLPFETPGWALLLSSFMAGFTIDLFNGTPGLHASAATIAGFLRPPVLRLLAPSGEYGPGTKPIIRDMGFRWFISYSFIISLVFHFALLWVELFEWSSLLQVIPQAIVATIFTTLLIILVAVIFSSGKTSRR